MSKPFGIHDGFSTRAGVKKPVVHRMTSADLVRFFVAFFILGVCFGLVLHDAWHDYKLPTPKVGASASNP